MRCSLVVRVLNNDSFLDTLSLIIITQIHHNTLRLLLTSPSPLLRELPSHEEKFSLISPVYMHSVQVYNLLRT